MEVWKVAVGALLVVGGCAQAPRARAITGPDGSEMFHVSCGADQGACFELAGRSCPRGYELAPVFGERDDNFLVRCRAASVATAESTPAPVAAPSAARPAPYTPEWPPPEQSWATPDPWSAASGAPASSNDLPPTHYLPNGQIDVGY